ncbi:glucosamine-6-phosphate deaminase [Tissierella creatinophila]|uniref:Glucosamine-6-phosphate deaminase n=1 Tax=Tissierella creatinophila DSM 6911 TaxID=1123403 RepID=A0A1U7M6Z6_TISCR|nr:glucosamine-6-phosphate deaminase [Tissierella creatinophila]OLS02968.1 glucosamine-6-phosphate deaminase 1 [Tissierella creatinophila DSM 6911]
MKLIVEKDYDGISKKAADILVSEVNNNSNITLGLATGSTPIGTYKEIVQRYKAKEVDFSNVKSFNLDEYVGLEGTNPNSYRYFMNENLFDHINIDKANTYVPDGKAKDLNSYTKEYDKLIEEMGGIDIQILGIGTNGHIAFNEPARELSVGTSVVHLTENTIMDNARFFKSLEEVPKTAITMGIGSILKAKKILLLASGENKREIIKKLLENDTLTTDLPASFLALHPDVTIIVDEAAYKG